MTTQSILITGCSSGIGLCAAQVLKQRGYRVFATARKTEDVAKLNSQGFESLELDVNDTNSMQHALNEILQRTGGTLDAVFNNAGYIQVGGIEDLTPELIRAQFATNTFGPMELVRLVLPIMRKQGHGRIIQNSSILGIITLPYYGAYNAAKFALEGFSRTLRQELHGTSIFVSLINPGPITSELRSNAYQQYEQTLRQQHSDVHKRAYQKIEQTYFNPSERDRKVMQAPKAVVKKLIQALESPRPKLHYYVGMPAVALAFLSRILPENILDWMLLKFR